MPKFVIGDTPNAKMTSYADDSEIHVHARNLTELKVNLEKFSNRIRITNTVVWWTNRQGSLKSNQLKPVKLLDAELYRLMKIKVT